MEEYLDFVSTNIEQKQMELEFLIKEYLKKDTLGAMIIPNKYFDNYWSLNEALPSLFYKSFILSWYSFVEYELIRLCSFMQIEKNIEFSPENVSGKGIGKARKYFRKVGLNLSELDWEELFKIRAIRNVLAHNDGSFEDYEFQRFRNYFIEYKLIRDKNNNEFIPSIHFCRHLIRFVKRFFENLHSESRRFNKKG